MNRRRLAQILVSATLVGLLIKLGGGIHIVDALNGTRLELIVLALMALTATRFLAVWRWQILLRAFGVAASPWRLVQVIFVSGFLGTFLPSTIGADVLNTLALARHVGGAASSASLLILDRLLGLVAVFLTALVAALLLLAWPVLGLEPAWVHATLLGCVLALSLLGLVLHPGSGRLLARAAARVPWRWLTQLLERFHQAHGMVGRRASVGLSVVTVAIVSQFASALAFFWLGQALALPITFVSCAIALPVFYVLAMLPVSLGGIGIEEGVLAGLVMASGGTVHQGAALALLYRVTWTTTLLPGAVLFALGGFARRSKRELSGRTVEMGRVL